MYQIDEQESSMSIQCLYYLRNFFCRSVLHSGFISSEFGVLNAGVGNDFFPGGVQGGIEFSSSRGYQEGGLWDPKFDQF